MSETRQGLSHGAFAVAVELHRRVALLPFGDHSEIGEEDVRCAGSSQQPCGRGVQIAQEPIADPVVRHRIHGLADLSEQLGSAGGLAAHAGQRDRIDRGEPTDGPVEVDIRPQNRAARAGEVHGRNAFADGGRNAAGQRSQQDLLGRGL